MHFPTPEIANFDITVASGLKSYPKIWCHTPTLSLEISEIYKILNFYELSATTWKLYMKHIVGNVKFIHAGHVILQLIH